MDPVQYRERFFLSPETKQSINHSKFNVHDCAVSMQLPRTLNRTPGTWKPVLKPRKQVDWGNHHVHRRRQPRTETAPGQKSCQLILPTRKNTCSPRLLTMWRCRDFPVTRQVSLPRCTETQFLAQKNSGKNRRNSWGGPYQCCGARDSIQFRFLLCQSCPSIFRYFKLFFKKYFIIQSLLNYKIITFFK